MDWDEDLPDHLNREWRRLVSYLEKTKEIHVPRYYHGQLHEKSDKIELFGFCDSSEEAYATSVYARVTQNSDSHVSLVASKSRVAPLDKQTVQPQTCLEEMKSVGNKVKQENSTIVTQVALWKETLSQLFHLKTSAVIKGYYVSQLMCCDL